MSREVLCLPFLFPDALQSKSFVSLDSVTLEGHTLFGFLSDFILKLVQLNDWLPASCIVGFRLKVPAGKGIYDIDFPTPYQ